LPFSSDVFSPSHRSGTLSLIKRLFTLSAYTNVCIIFIYSNYE